MSNPLNTPYWWDAAGPKLKSLATLPETLPTKVGTLIVGAGYTGLHAALTLARSGRDVIVVDAEHPGFGCSARNGGLIGPSFHKLGVAGLNAAFGTQKATEILQESMDSLQYLKDFISNEDLDTGLHLTGRFRGAPRPEHYETIARDCEMFAKTVGQAFHMIPKSEQHAEIGTDYYNGGVVYPDDGHLHPGKYAASLAEMVIDAGATIIAPARVSGIQTDGTKHAVHIKDQTIVADQVLIATNGYTGPELPWYRRRVMPIRSAIICTEELSPEMMQSLSPKNRGFGDGSRLVLYYRPSPDGKRMVFGGRAFNLRDKPENYTPDLLWQMLRIFPQLEGVKLSHTWSGTVAYTFNHAPAVGQHKGLFHAMGYCGSGIGRASYFGHKIALQMLGDPKGKTALDGLSFPTKPFYTGTPWFLPAILRWNSVMDRFGR
ncbi:NAD(P)/FAD-dependent oxidoreductase [Cochlodiniinecator piscidefendens]|uniref:NAD(P)/FAD-dependent oxidoreductase n=1 Tax=Cochlodiniinecator piscidefendens TaxID=2715756 RepID=UPI001407528E|nr:FAD-dependent oxidoreductase [Cochlodiniinecator piscidefendens]